jgi:hypothetical protein
LKDLLEASNLQRKGKKTELDDAWEKISEMAEVKFIISYNPLFGF